MKKLFFILALLPFLFSCNNSEEKRNSELQSLNEQKNEFYNKLTSSDFDFEEVRNLADNYESFIESYPKDIVCSKLTIELANIYVNFLGDPDKDIELYSSIEEKYHDSEYLPESYFAIANIYNDRLHKLGKASEYYRKLTEEFSDHELSKQAKFLMENIGKTPEELLDVILKKKAEREKANKNDSIIN